MSASAVEVRTTNPGDAETLSRIGEASFRAAYAVHSTPDGLDSHLQQYFSIDAVRDSFDDSDCTYLLATINGEGCGYAKLRRRECPVESPSQGALELQQLYIAPATQRGGVGGALVQAVLANARASGASGVWLSVWQDAGWATNFYDKNGFEVIGIADFQMGLDVFTDNIMWQPVTQE